MSNPISYERYHRQIILNGFGEAAQQKLQDAKVLVIGAGGLGCPALQYLAAAGIGMLGVVDGDSVSLSNLQRQVLYTVNDIGVSKAETAANVLSHQNPEIKITAYPEYLTTTNTLSIISEYDIIVDGTDNFASRYMINDACVILDKTLIYGAVSQYEGQIAILNYHTKNGSGQSVNYRDLFPQPPKESEVRSCAQAGVLGVLPGIIGTMQASETIKLLTGIGEPLINRMLTFNVLNNQFYELELTASKETRLLIPENIVSFMLMDYEWLCGAMVDECEIDVIFFDDLLTKEKIEVVDVRELDELPPIIEFDCYRIPQRKLQENRQLFQSGTIVTICQSGNRSLDAAKQLRTIFGHSKKIYSLRGGIIQWKKVHLKAIP